MKLHRKDSFINYAPEEKPRGIELRKQVSRLIYFCILFLILFSVVTFIYEKSFTIKGHGLVSMDIHQVKAVDDIILNNICIMENDEVHPGDTLFFRRLYDGYYGHGQIDPLLRERIVRADRDIALKYAEIHCAKEETNQLSNYMVEVRKRYLLEMETFSEISKAKNELLKRENHISQLKSEIAALQDYRSRLEMNSLTSYVSPIRGYVLEIYQKPHATVKRDDPIVDIGLPGTMRITGFFKQDYHKHLVAGKEVAITFPDGNAVKGEIVNRHTTTHFLPEIFLKLNEPARRYVVVDIIPFEMDPKVLSQYNMLSVELILKR
ncbi:MAG: hypothetical protein ACOC4C_01870 [Fibrobacterota bacterium]